MLVKKPSGEMIYDEKYIIEERITEKTKFVGPFFVEYNLLKDGVCVVISYVEVPIGMS